jgi:peptidoglycan/LPS O-acetylase OafA/YrhL
MENICARLALKSSEGKYFAKLDHVRAFAAYLVFVWHFTHLTAQFPVPTAASPYFPFALLEEGHTGVALFMTLSGYLFAKLVGQERIVYCNFLWSRFVRLAPLLIMVTAAWYIYGRLGGPPIAIGDIICGLIFPTLPGGGWSITVEAHFYLIFPMLLLLVRRYGPGALLAVLMIAVLYRLALWVRDGEVQVLAYWTILGRIDQFLLGMFFCFMPFNARQRAWIAGIAGVSFLMFWQLFDDAGGYYGSYPSRNPVWIIIPTIEALAYASFIRWYDESDKKLPAGLGSILAVIGEWSYSIYLLHFFFREAMIGLVGDRVGSADNLWWALPFATVCFLIFLPVAGASYTYFEKWFFRFRRPYLKTTASTIGYDEALRLRRSI